METLMTILIIWKLNCLSDNCMSSRNISHLGAVIADLPTPHRQFRLITPRDGCVDTLPTGDWTCNMISNYTTLPVPKKVFFNLQLSDFYWGSTATVLITGVDDQPIKVCWILPVIHPGVLYQHAASASSQEVHIEKTEGQWSNWAISSCSLFLCVQAKSNIHLLFRISAL